MLNKLFKVVKKLPKYFNKKNIIICGSIIVLLVIFSKVNIVELLENKKKISLVKIGEDNVIQKKNIANAQKLNIHMKNNSLNDCYAVTGKPCDIQYKTVPIEYTQCSADPSAYTPEECAIAKSKNQVDLLTKMHKSN